MNKKYITFGVIIIIVGIVLFSVAKSPDTVTTKVVLSDPAGLQINGLLTADGEKRDVNETLPAEISIEAKRMSLLINSPDESETLSATVYVNGRQCVSGAQRRIRIDVTGNTLFSAPRVFLKAY
jgi:hypothetical protein